MTAAVQKPCRRAPAALFLCSALLGYPRLAAAQSPLSLRWTAPADCPSAEDVRSLALSSAGHDAAIGTALEAEAEVSSFEREGARRYRVELSTRRGTEQGERSIEAATCSGVAEATALVLSLALTAPLAAPEDGAVPPVPAGDDSGHPSAPEASTPPSAAPPPETQLAPVRAPEARSATLQAAPSVHSAPHESALALGISLAGDTATLPSAAAGGALSLAWHTAGVRLEIEARRWIPQSRTAPAFDAGARFSMMSFGLRGCWLAASTDAFELGPCAGPDLHIVSAPGYGVEPDYDASAEWMALGVGARAACSCRRGSRCAPGSKPRFHSRGRFSCSTGEGRCISRPRWAPRAGSGPSCSFSDETRWPLPLMR